MRLLTYRAQGTNPYRNLAVEEALLEGVPRDTCILWAGGEEGICLAALDLEQLRAYRASEVHGNAYRRPAGTAC